MTKIKVAVNGYGVIGKRVADAVQLQDDMELIGVCDLVSDWRIKIALRKNYPVYAFDGNFQNQMIENKIEIKGTLADLIKVSDIIIDCTPKKIASQNIEQYKRAGLKFIVQGGEKHETTGHSFSAENNSRGCSHFLLVAPLLPSSHLHMADPHPTGYFSERTRIMATFYVLPSRHLFGQRFADLFGSLFPGTRYTPWDWPDLAEALGGLVEAQTDAHVVYREDLDEDMSVKDGLLRHFGADLHDEIIEIEFGPGLNQFVHQQWATEKRRAA